VTYEPVGRWTIVGAGAVVLKELPSNVTAVGVPARIVEVREEGWQAAA
jgi:serine acetyltransferase